MMMMMMMMTGNTRVSTGTRGISVDPKNRVYTCTLYSGGWLLISPVSEWIPWLGPLVVVACVCICIAAGLTK